MVSRHITVIGAHIESANGEYAPSLVDASFRGRGLRLQLRRQYRSGLANRQGLFARGWLSPLERRLINAADGVIYEDADGTRHHFLLRDRQYQTPAGLYSLLVASADRFALRQAGGRTLWFEPPDHGGRIVAVEDRNGNAIRFAHRENAIEIVDTVGRRLSVHLAGGRIERIVDNAGRAWAYAYDSHARLVALRLPSAALLRYTYDDAHRLVVVTDANGDDVVRNRYDGEGRVVEQWWGRERFLLRYEREPAPRTHVQLAAGAVLELVHDAGGRVVERTLRANDGEAYTTRARFNRHGERVARTSADGRRTEWRYDEDAPDPRNRGNLRDVLRFAGEQAPIRIAYEYDSRFQQVRARTEARGHVTAYEHDARGNVTAIRRAVTVAGKREEFCTRFEYDATGLLIRRVDASGGVTRYGYGADGLLARVETVDAAGRPLRGRAYRYDAVGNVVEIVDGKGNATRLSYDADGRVVGFTARAPAAYRAAIRRDANGNPIEEIVHDGEREVFRRTYAYDERNRIVRITASAGAEVRTRELVRDASGRVVRRVDPGGQVTEFAYDARGRMIERRRNAGTPGASVARRRYDAGGRLRAVQDDLGRTVAYHYDAWQRPTGATDRVGTRRMQELDAAGNVVLRRTIGRAGAEETTLAETRYHYDELGRCTRIERMDPDSGKALAAGAFIYSGTRLARIETENRNAVHFDYDAAGQLIEAKDATGQSMRLDYDANGNLVRVEHRGTAQTRSVVELGYDALDRLVAQSVDGAAPQVRAYDALGRLTRRGSARYIRDALGRIAEVHTPSGVVRLRWDQADRVVERVDTHGRQWRYRYDERDLLNAVVHPGGKVTHLVYDRARNPVQISGFAGHTLKLEFDAEDRLVARTSTDGDAHLAERFERDALGRIVTATSGAVHLRLRYDPLSRLVSEDVAGRAVRYRYDKMPVREVIQPDGSRLMWEADRLERPSALRDETHALLVHTSYDLGHLAVQDQVDTVVASYASGEVSYRAAERALVASRLIPNTGGRTTIRTVFAAHPTASTSATTHASGDCADQQTSYDPRGRLVRVECRSRAGTTKRIEYAYDALDRLARKTVHTEGAGVEVRFIWNGPRLAQIVDPRVGTWDLLYGASDRRPVVLRRRSDTSAELFVCLWDARGVVVGLVDRDGRIAERYALDDLGRRRVTEIDGRAVAADTDAPSGNPVLAEGSLWDGDAQLALLDRDRKGADGGGADGGLPPHLDQPLEPVPIPEIEEKLPWPERFRRMKEIADEEHNARERWRRDQQAQREWREWMELMDQLDKALKDLRNWLWGRLSEECLKGNDLACAQLGDPELFPESALGDAGPEDDDDTRFASGGVPTSGGDDDDGDRGDGDDGTGSDGDDPDPPESGDPPDEAGGTVAAMPGTDIVVGPGVRRWGPASRGAESISLAAVITRLWGGVIDPPFDDVGWHGSGAGLVGAAGLLEPFAGDFVDVVAGSRRLYPPRARPGVTSGGDPRAPGWTDPPEDAVILAESALAGQTNERPGSDALVVAPGACAGGCAEPGCGRRCARV
ncbi:MAG: DUF6531 domain-containing protein [Sulfurifustaceae bacterium]